MKRIQFRIVSTLLVLITSGCVTRVSTVEFAPLSDGAEDFVAMKYVLDSSSDHFFGATTISTVVPYLKNEKPLAWGRYIINTASKQPQNAGIRELAVAEAMRFADSKLLLVPIVTPDQGTLAGSYADGHQLAIDAASLVDLLVGVAKVPEYSSQILVFLDVEGTKPLSDDFLLGWCEGIAQHTTSGKFSVIPGLYAPAKGPGRNVREVLQRTSDRCAIKGLWLAYYPKSIVPPASPPQWLEFRSDRLRTLPSIPDQIPIYLWQYHSATSPMNIDYNVVNPDLSDDFASHLLQLWR